MTTTQGLRGAVRVELIFDDERAFAPGRKVWLADLQNPPDRSRSALEIEFLRQQHGRYVLKLRGIDSIDAALPLVGREIGIDENDLPPIDAGAFYTFHLKGCQVFTVERECLGTIKSVLACGGADILTVENAGREILIPFAERYIRQIDIAGRWIEVDLPAELRELNR